MACSQHHFSSLNTGGSQVTPFLCLLVGLFSGHAHGQVGDGSDKSCTFPLCMSFLSICDLLPVLSLIR